MAKYGYFEYTSQLIVVWKSVHFVRETCAVNLLNAQSIPWLQLTVDCKSVHYFCMPGNELKNDT